MKKWNIPLHPLKIIGNKKAPPKQGQENLRLIALL